MRSHEHRYAIRIVGGLETGALRRCGRRADRRVAVLHPQGPLRAPVPATLRHDVQRLLDGGQRLILLDLSCVPEVDAAGVGEVVRAYNMATAARGALSVGRTADRVAELLDRAGLLQKLSHVAACPASLKTAFG
jgi:anti-anti-sigma factor